MMALIKLVMAYHMVISQEQVVLKTKPMARQIF